MFKQYVIIPKKPKMTPGKIASQTAHATFMALEKQKNKAIIKAWKESGMCVIVLQCSSPTQLYGIAHYLDEWKIANHLYIDEGMTEVEMGTPTALATEVLGPEWQWIFKNLELLR